MAIAYDFLSVSEIAVASSIINKPSVPLQYMFTESLADVACQQKIIAWNDDQLVCNMSRMTRTGNVGVCRGSFILPC
jgi:hypothetical protein